MDFHVQTLVEGAPTVTVVICYFLRLIGSSNSLTKRDLLDVCSLSCRMIFRFVSEPLQLNLRFFQDPCLKSPSATPCEVLSHLHGSDARLPAFHCKEYVGLGSCY